jgi:transposase-like protein
VEGFDKVRSQGDEVSCCVLPSSTRYPRHRFPAEIIAYAVWLYSSAGRNNRIEQSHQPTRQRERRMQGFPSIDSAQRFLSTFT